VALLFDAYGREVYEGGLTHDDIRDAIQAAALADDFKLAYEIAERYGWNNVCLSCAAVFPTVADLERYGHWPVCAPCKVRLEPLNFSDTRLYMQGLISRDVQ
jgi:hypothetical protein